MTASLDRYRSWAISLLFHLAVLAAMSFYAFPQLINPKWYEISFGEQALEPEETFADREAAVPTGEDLLTGAAMDRKAQAANPGSGQPANPSQLTAPALGHSEILETPSTTNTRSKAPALSSNPLAQAALRSLASGSSDSADGGGVGIAVQGGRVRFRLPSGYKHNLGAGGSVTLQFKVDKFARPIPGTIVSAQQTEGRMYEAAKKVLLDGDLSFIGEPNPGVTCIITIEFL